MVILHKKDKKTGAKTRGWHLLLKSFLIFFVFLQKGRELFLKTLQLVTFCSNLCYIIIVTVKIEKGEEV